MSVGRWRRRACAPTWRHASIPHAIAALLHGLLKLLLLRVGHQRFQLLMRVHHRRAHLLMALLWAQCSVVLNCIHLLVLVLQDGQHLLLLILGQVQHLCQALQLMLRRWRLMMMHGLCTRIGLLIRCALWGWGRSRVLRKHRRRNAKSDSENCNSRAHSSEKFSRIHVDSFLQDTRRTAMELVRVNCRSTVCRSRRQAPIGSCARHEEFTPQNNRRDTADLRKSPSRLQNWDSGKPTTTRAYRELNVTPQLYSARRASTGLTEAARRAGK